MQNNSNKNSTGFLNTWSDLSTRMGNQLRQTLESQGTELSKMQAEWVQGAQRVQENLNRMFSPGTTEGDILGAYNKAVKEMGDNVTKMNTDIQPFMQKWQTATEAVSKKLISIANENQEAARRLQEMTNEFSERLNTEFHEMTSGRRTGPSGLVELLTEQTQANASFASERMKHAADRTEEIYATISKTVSELAPQMKDVQARFDEAYASTRREWDNQLDNATNALVENTNIMIARIFQTVPYMSTHEAQRFWDRIYTSSPWLPQSNQTPPKRNDTTDEESTRKSRKK